MTVFEEYLRTFLLEQSDISSIFDARIYPLKVPQDEMRAALTYLMHKRDTAAVLAGATGRENRLYILTVWDRSYLAAKQNSEALQLILDQTKQEMGPFLVTCFGKDQRDVFDHEAQLFGVETDFNLIFMNYPTL